MCEKNNRNARGVAIDADDHIYVTGRFRGIVDFGDTQVRSVMTPRVEMVSASLDISLEELSKIFFESKQVGLIVRSIKGRDHLNQATGFADLT